VVLAEVTEVFISIGSNIDREQHIRNAVKGLRELDRNLRLSPVYETAAVGFDGPPFYNLVVSLQAQDVDQLKQQLLSLEDRAQRDRVAQKFSSRTLDLDILLFGDADLRHRGYDIPRQEIVRYAFVLKPLSDLAAQRCYPGTTRTLGQLWSEFEQQFPDQCLSIHQVHIDDL